MFGTKCPSMMSTCSSVPPPSSACLACAAKLAKLADRIEGASSIIRGKVFAPGLWLGVAPNSDTQNDYTQNAAFTAHFQHDSQWPRISRATAFVGDCLQRTVPMCTSIAKPLRRSPVVLHFLELRRVLVRKNRDNRRARSVPSLALTPRHSKVSSCPSLFPAQLPNHRRRPADLPATALPADRARVLRTPRGFPGFDSAAADLARTYFAQGLHAFRRGNET